jgi:hypothetical protein
MHFICFSAVLFYFLLTYTGSLGNMDILFFDLIQLPIKNVNSITVSVSFWTLFFF